MTIALSPLATPDRLFFERDDAALDRGTAERLDLRVGDRALHRIFGNGP